MVFMSAFEKLKGNWIRMQSNKVRTIHNETNFDVDNWIAGTHELSNFPF